MIMVMMIINMIIIIAMTIAITVVTKLVMIKWYVFILLKGHPQATKCVTLEILQFIINLQNVISMFFYIFEHSFFIHISY